MEERRETNIVLGSQFSKEGNLYRTMLIRLIFFVAFVTTLSSVKACSIACVTPTTPLGNLLSHDVTARIWVGEELDQPGVTVDPMMPWGQKHYYKGRLRRLYKGEHDHHESRHIIVRTNNNCGASLPQEKASYLMFGSIQEEEVPGMKGTMPVFVLAGGCIPNSFFKDISWEHRRQLRAYRRHGPICLPSDCPQNVVVAADICPDMATFNAPHQTCQYMKDSNSCEWEITPVECPGCKLDSDCAYDKDLLCNADGLCERFVVLP